MMFHAHKYQKKAEVTIPIPDKIDFKMKIVIKGKDGHYKIMR